MALPPLGSIPLCTSTILPPPGKLKDVVRRTGNYKPSIWDDDYLQSLSSVYEGEPYISHAKKLKDNVRMMLEKLLEPLDQLELIDDLERLGISYQFEEEIEKILKSIYISHNSNDKWNEDYLYATALEFRLLRQHGYLVPQEVFNSFKDEMGNFKVSLCKDTKGMLSLYEASYLSMEGESILDEAKDFTTKRLEKDLEENMDQYLAMQVSHALEHPLHWRMQRLETRQFIDVYERRQDMNPILLELAKLDFNMVQAIYQEDLKNTSSSMALPLLGSIPPCTSTILPPEGKLEDVVRRTGNYKPCIWDDDYLQSLSSVYEGEPYISHAKKLKDNVRMMLEKLLEPLDQLELIDDLERLGISYHFEEETEKIVKSIYISHNSNDKWNEEDLYATALEFRLLRQHGYLVPQEVFNSFKDEMGNFKVSLCKDTKGMLSLYEASYLSIEGESILDVAKDFTTKHLEENLEENMDQYLAMQVSHALEHPLHWRMQRLETRRFIDVYERRQDMNPILLELAKLDFNMVQAIYQEDLKNTSRWWRHLGLTEKLSFARDRLVESFLWAAGATFKPQYSYCRRITTKVVALITVIDDIYDVYGTLDELEQFTDAVERWELKAMEDLPDYMKICFLALYNFINEMGYDALKVQGSYIIPYLKKEWADLCKAYLVEAKWYYSGYTPTLEEYLNNGCTSIATPLTLIHIYFSTSKSITKEALESWERYSSILRWAARTFRLVDDLGTSSDELKRGDVPKSIQCFMNESGASEDAAHKYLRNLIDYLWKKMNECQFGDSPFSQTFIGAAMDSIRTAQCLYQYGDGHGVPDLETKDRVLSLFIKPISL